jgi:hypothetical protein
MSGQQNPGIDPRSPRFGAGTTAVLLLVVIGLAVGGAQFPALILFSAITLLFAWGAFAGVQRHPYGRLYKRFVRPRLQPPSELEDPIPPTFAQGVGFAITLIGVILTVLGLPLALPIAAGLAFIAAFLNSVFGYCLGCQIYLLLARLGVVGRNRPAAA